jgi:hypothetical protein
MTAGEALSFIEKHGVVLVSAKGPVPKLAEEIVGGPIRGSWWAHPRSPEIFAILQAVSGSKDVLVCRLVNAKVTLVHRRLWPALARVAKRFRPEQIAQLHEEHMASGRHVTREVAFPEWAPAQVVKRAKVMTEEEALESLGPWSRHLTTPVARRAKGGS